jgi:hypothetical protein
MFMAQILFAAESRPPDFAGRDAFAGGDLG